MNDKLMFIGKRGMIVCLVMAVVFIIMKAMGAIGDAAFVELVKWDLLGFYGAKGLEYLPTFGKK